MSVIKVNHKGKMLFETSVGKHTIKIDVPESMAGKNRGPTPPQFFIISLASCIAAFIANYCKNAKINTKDLSVSLSFEKFSNPTSLGNLKAVVKIPNGDFEKNKKAILRVANLCPVHKSIEKFKGIDIEIKK
ncbi:MAG: OsmC family protein [Patescibacteria group bacterium]|nr:OsmC family protein [Patescibacteria group bacterium]